MIPEKRSGQRKHLFQIPPARAEALAEAVYVVPAVLYADEREQLKELTGNQHHE